MKPRTRYVWAASGYLSVYWLPLVHERCILAANWLSGHDDEPFAWLDPDPAVWAQDCHSSEVVSMALPDPRPTCPASQLGCEVIWLGPCDGGGNPGVAPTVPGTFERLRARVAGSAASLCSPNLGHALD